MNWCATTLASLPLSPSCSHVSSPSCPSRWDGAPPPLFCAPKSRVPAAPQWSYGTGIICNPPASADNATFPSLNSYLNYVESYGNRKCRDYAGQVAGKWESCGAAGCPNDPAPGFGKGERTDVENCCWWGRGVIQTTGEPSHPVEALIVIRLWPADGHAFKGPLHHPDVPLLDRPLQLWEAQLLCGG